MTLDDRITKVNALRLMLSAPLPCECCGETYAYRWEWESPKSGRTARLCHECYRLINGYADANETPHPQTP